MARLWGLYRDRGRWVIRKGAERLPSAKYRRIAHDESLLREYVLRLNGPDRVRTQVEIRHAFIDDALLSEYHEWLHARIPTPRSADAELQLIKKHFLNYFISKLGLVNPADWYAVHDSKWAQYLLSKEVPAAAHSKRVIIQAANKFMDWLHRRRPEEVPKLQFKPLSKAVLKKIEAARELAGEVRDRKLVTDEAWKRIEQKAEARLLPFARLSLWYGMRRSEVLGVKPGDVKRGYLSVERQLEALSPEPTYRPLKGRERRSVPHWFAEPAFAYGEIENAQRHLVNPTTLTKLWAKLMSDLGLDYDFHDLRHTFITKAIRLHHPRDVQLAAGHKNIETTMRYLHDDRTMDDEEFKPAS